MSLKAQHVTFDCADPAALASFWAKATDGEIVTDFGVWVVLRTPNLGLPALGFQQVPEPKGIKNRVHIDFTADDREAEVDRLISLGAARIDDHEVADLRWTVMGDPDGNEFCVVQARKRSG